MPSIVIDFSVLQAFLTAPISVQIWTLFIYGGWIPFIWFLLWASWRLWVISRQLKWLSGIRYVLLAVDVPKDTEQSPKAVEHFFSHLSGGYRHLVLKEKYWEGQTQPIFSLELISIGGNIQYLIRTQVKYRDLVEAALFAQYPDAEIAEVADYTEATPRIFPSETHDMWGTEFVLSKPNAYPIRTYPQFEHSLSQEFKDPLISLLEALAKMRAGEQIWLQIILTPTTSDWREAGGKLVNKILGKKEVIKPTLVEQAVGASVSVVSGVADAILGVPPAEPKDKKKEDMPLRMLALSPGERDVIEAMQMKLSKIGFMTKFRFVYIAEKQVFQKGPRIAIIKGALSQFNTLNLNGFKNFGRVTPKSDYFWQRWVVSKKKTRLVAAYRGRSNWRGAPAYILNTEELATIFHFPQIIVKAPLIKKTESKRAEPPFGLPMAAPKAAKVATAPKTPEERRLPDVNDSPSNLPVMEP